MEMVRLILYFGIGLLCVLSINGQKCNDLDSDVCNRLSTLNPNMCTDSCLSSICQRFCGHCPLKCYECHEVDHPANCTNLVDCPSKDHYCFTTQTFTDDFHEVYKMGCAMRTLCEQNVHSDKRSDLSVKGGCCTMDMCNNILPEKIDLLPQQTTVMVQNTTVPPITTDMVCANMDDDICLRISLTDPSFCSNDCIASNICPRMCRKCFQCYDCNDIDRPEDCNNTSTCQSGKECFQLETLSVDLRPVYRLGCLDETLCQRFGAPVQTGFGRRQQGISLKGGCCRTDLCNGHIHKPVTMAATTTTPVPTTSCVNHNHNHNHGCPTGYTYETHTRSCYHIGTQKLSWKDSKNYCTSTCGRLADFSSIRSLADVISHVNSQYRRMDLWVGAVKDSHGHWIWDNNHSRISSDLNQYMLLSRSKYKCAAAHHLSRTPVMSPVDCPQLLHPLCEAHRSK